MKNEDRFYSMLGLAQKGNMIVSGSECCKNAVIEGKARLLIISEDCGENTHKLFKDKCLYRRIRLLKAGNKYDIGKSIGKGVRTVVAVMDDGIADAIIRLYNELNNNSANLSGGE